MTIENIRINTIYNNDIDNRYVLYYILFLLV